LAQEAKGASGRLINTNTTPSERAARGVGLLLITQQFSLRVPDLQAVPINDVMIWAQGFGGFKRRLERLKGPHSMAAVSRDVKRSV
jgi:hypothetical protein